MKRLIANGIIVLSLLCFFLQFINADTLADTGPYANVSPTFPRGNTLYRQLQKELHQYANIVTGLHVFSPEIQETPADLRKEAQLILDFYGTDTTGVILMYAEETNEAAVVVGTENSVLTDEDIAAVETAFIASNADDSYDHVINGLKQLMICVFDGGDFEIPEDSFAAEYLREAGVPAQGLPADVWIAAGVVVIAVVVLAALLLRRRVKK